MDLSIGCRKKSTKFILLAWWCIDASGNSVIIVVNPGLLFIYDSNRTSSKKGSWNASLWKTMTYLFYTVNTSIWHSRYMTPKGPQNQQPWNRPNFPGNSSFSTRRVKISCTYIFFHIHIIYACHYICICIHIICEYTLCHIHIAISVIIT